MMSGFVGSTVMAWTLVPSGSPLVSCSQPPSPTRRKIPGRLPDVNEPTPTYTRDGLDVTRENDWQEAVALAEQRFGKLNVLVNNAGISATGRVEDTPLEAWQRVMEVNATGVFLGSKAAIPAMRRAGGGSIVNISSQLGLVGTDITSPMYPASKGAVRLLTKVAAIQYAKEGIRANSVHPGPIVTPMTEKRRADPAIYQMMLSRS